MLLLRYSAADDHYCSRSMKSWPWARVSEPRLGTGPAGEKPRHQIGVKYSTPERVSGNFFIYFHSHETPHFPSVWRGGTAIRADSNSRVQRLGTVKLRMVRNVTPPCVGPGPLSWCRAWVELGAACFRMVHDATPPSGGPGPASWPSILAQLSFGWSAF